MMGGLMMERLGAHAEQIVARASHVVPLDNADLERDVLGSRPEAFVIVWAGFHKAILPNKGAKKS